MSYERDAQFIVGMVMRELTKWFRKNVARPLAGFVAAVMALWIATWIVLFAVLIVLFWR